MIQKITVSSVWLFAALILGGFLTSARAQIPQVSESSLSDFELGSSTKPAYRWPASLYVVGGYYYNYDRCSAWVQCNNGRFISCQTHANLENSVPCTWWIKDGAVRCTGLNRAEKLVQQIRTCD